MSKATISNGALGRTLLLVVIFILTAFPALPQQGDATAPGNNAQEAGGEEKAEQILQRALEAHGGRAFMTVQSLVSRGLFTQFQDGAPVPSSFTDYLVFPDRERTEFRGQGIRIIQTNVGDKGWVYDGTTRTIKDIKPAQAKDFQISLRTGIDNVLRGWWRKEGAKLSYVGRREAGLAKRNEVVRLTYPDGFKVEFEFGAKDNLLAKALYKRQNSEGEEVEEEDRFAQHLTIEGVTLPFVIDHFRAGTQSSRINYQTVEFNRPVPDSLFARPADVKSIK